MSHYGRGIGVVGTLALTLVFLGAGGAWGGTVVDVGSPVLQDDGSTYTPYRITNDEMFYVHATGVQPTQADINWLSNYSITVSNGGEISGIIGGGQSGTVTLNDPNAKITAALTFSADGSLLTVSDGQVNANVNLIGGRASDDLAFSMTGGVIASGVTISNTTDAGHMSLTGGTVNDSVTVSTETGNITVQLDMDGKNGVTFDTGGGDMYITNTIGNANHIYNTDGGNIEVTGSLTLGTAARVSVGWDGTDTATGTGNIGRMSSAIPSVPEGNIIVGANSYVGTGDGNIYLNSLGIGDASTAEITVAGNTIRIGNALSVGNDATVHNAGGDIFVSGSVTMLGSASITADNGSLNLNNVSGGTNETIEVNGTGNITITGYTDLGAGATVRAEHGDIRLSTSAGRENEFGNNSRVFVGTVDGTDPSIITSYGVGNITLQSDTRNEFGIGGLIATGTGNISAQNVLAGNNMKIHTDDLGTTDADDGTGSIYLTGTNTVGIGSIIATGTHNDSDNNAIVANNLTLSSNSGALQSVIRVTETGNIRLTTSTYGVTDIGNSGIVRTNDGEISISNLKGGTDLKIIVNAADDGTGAFNTGTISMTGINTAGAGTSIATGKNSGGNSDAIYIENLNLGSSAGNMSDVTVHDSGDITLVTTTDTGLTQIDGSATVRTNAGNITIENMDADNAVHIIVDSVATGTGDGTGDITITSKSADVINTAGANAVIGTGTGDVTIDHFEIGAGATIGANDTGNVTLDHKWGDDDSDRSTIGAGAEITAGGNGTKGNVYMTKVDIDDDLTMTAGSNIEMLKSDIADNAVITAGNDIRLTQSTIKGNAAITSSGGWLILDDHSEIGDSAIPLSLGKGIQILNNSKLGSNRGDATDPLVLRDDLYVYNNSSLGSDNYITIVAPGGNITFDMSSTLGSNNTITSVEGNITFSDRSGAGDNNTLATLNGDILIIEASWVGNENELGTQSGNITITGNAFDDMSKVGDFTTITSETGNIRIVESSIGKESTVLTKTGDIYIKDATSEAGSSVSSLGSMGEGREVILTGDKTDFKGEVIAGGRDDNVTIDMDGYYALVKNEGGSSVFNINGAHTEVFDSTVNTTTTGSTYYLNKYDDPDTGRKTWLSTDRNNQVVQNIVGNAMDMVEVQGGIAYSQYTGANALLANGRTAYIYEFGKTDTDTLVNAQVNTITGEDAAGDTVNITSLVLEDGSKDVRTVLEISPVGYQNSGKNAWLDVATVNVGKNADLFVHKSGTHQYVTDHDNLINDLTADGAGSRIWLDQATVRGGDADGLAKVSIGDAAMLTGFNTDDRVNGTVANVVGDVLLGTGATLKPFDTTLYDWEFMLEKADTIEGDRSLGNESEKGFIITKNADGEGGTLSLAGGSILESRLFSSEATTTVTVIAGYDANGNAITANVNVNNGDYAKADSATFLGQAVFTPTFGNDNELYTKQQFKVYQGDSVDTEGSYYYNIVRTDNPVVANGLGNNMFGRDILFSDMLGEWVFELDESRENVLLRFRLLAAHPTQGGIAKDMLEPNAREAAIQLDRIRYPYDHNAATRYDGDMVAAYEELHKQDPDKYPNYKKEYIQDFMDLLGGIQEEITSGAVLNHAIRRLHPEPYTALADMNLYTSRQFRRTIEQNLASALYAVEDNLYYENEGGSNRGYASVPVGTQYVCDPIRFWASGFGADGTQKRRGTEYGYDTEMWGGALGVIKEIGDCYIGLTGGYARLDTDWNELHASAKTDAYMVDLVLGARFGMAFLEVFGQYGYHDQKMTRDINIQSYTGTATGEYHDNVYGGGLRMGYQLVMGNWLFMPTVGVNYFHSKAGSFSEKGRLNQATLLEFRSGSIKRHNFEVPIMARLSRSFPVFCSFVLTPEIRVGFTPNFGKRQSRATARFVGDPSAGGWFTAQGLDRGRYTGQAGATIELSRRGRFHASANYDYVFARDNHDHNYSLRFGFNF